MDIHFDKHGKDKKTKIHVKTKEFIAIVILVVFIIVAIKPSVLTLVVNEATKLINTPGLKDFVSMITTK